MSQMLNTPVPGDIVIRPDHDMTGLRRNVVFVATIWPNAEVLGGPYQSYGYALRQAREFAGKRRVQLWREHSFDAERSQLENVSE
jgi:hypothetical protein